MAPEEQRPSSSPISVQPASAGPGVDASQVALSNQQLALYRALTGVGEPPAGGRLARRYLGALAALTSPHNPERLAQAGHSLREMMDLIPEAVDIRVEALREKLGNEAAKLEGAWRAAQKSACLKDGKWQGTIDRPLERFLLAAGLFYSWKEEHQPRRRTEFGLILVELDVSKKPAPKVLQALNVEAWIEMHNYFVTVAHHGDSVDPGEFESWLDVLERTILNLLVPRTFEDFDKIDAILGAEVDA